MMKKAWGGRTYFLCIVLLWVVILLGIRTGAAEPPQTEYRLPFVCMDISQIDQKTGSFAVGESHSWIIRAEIPEDIADKTEFTVTQTLDSGLRYEEGSLTVYLHRSGLQDLALVMGQQYSLTTGAVREDGISDRICVALTGEGIGYLAKMAAVYREKMELWIVYEASISTAAKMGRQMIGTAQLHMTGSGNHSHVITSDKASVYTGGLQLLLTDSEGIPLSGGTFMLAKTAEEPFWPEVELLDAGKEQIPVIYMAFYTNQSLNGDKSYQVTTDCSGDAILYGLPFGDYYLVQTAAPQGILQNPLPIPVRIHEVSHIVAEDGWTNGSGQPADHRVHIIARRMTLPETGGPGTAGYTVWGMVFLLLSGLLLLCKGKRADP